MIGRTRQDFPWLEDRHGGLEGAKAKCEASANASVTSVEVYEAKRSQETRCRSVGGRKYSNASGRFRVKATAEERGHGNLECQSRAVQKRG
jgi:hypothetical protein